MKYIIYLRVSTDEQDTRTQEYHCIQHIQRMEREAFQHIVFSDPDTSSRIPMENRHGLQEALKAMKRGDIVVVSKLDRLSRDVIEMVTIYRQIKDKKCGIISLSEANCDNEFMMGLMGTLAQKERKDISDRTKAALAAKKSRGERTGRIPYGYRLSEKVTVVDGVERRLHIEPCPKEQETLAWLNHHHDHGMSFRQLETYCESLEIRNRQGGKFYHRDIWHAVKNLHPDYKSGDSIPTHSRSDLSLQCV